jgi:hypothetical protein
MKNSEKLFATRSISRSATSSSNSSGLKRVETKHRFIGWRWGTLLLLLAVLLPPAPASAESADSERTTSLKRFEMERLVLLDHRGHPIGPEKSGFSAHDFGMFNAERFHAVHAGDLRYRLTFEEFMRLTQNQVFEERWAAAHEKVRRQSRTSKGLIVAGSILATGGLIIGSLAYASGEDDLALSLPLVFGGAAGLFIGGGALATSSKIRREELASQNLEFLSNRDEAWTASRAYNEALWQALSLEEEASPPPSSSSEQPVESKASEVSP